MKRKVILYFTIIIILTLSLVMAVFGVALTKYYYQGIANTFQNHVKAVDPFWEKGIELHYGSLEDYSDLVIKNYQYDGAELQLLNVDGELIQSSTGYYEEQTYKLDPDVFSYKTIYKKEEIGQSVLAVYTPLILDGQIVGILRYVSSLTLVQEVITSLLEYGLLISLGVALIVFLISLRLTDSIVKPVNEIILVTEEMSKGHFEQRIKEDFPYEIGEMARTLNYMAEEIVKTERMKNDFISSISHELRTPLTGIKGWAETMRLPDGLSKEETEFGLQMINSESERLMNLVEDLLDFSRYESNRVTFIRTVVEFDTLIKEVSFQLQKKASEKNVQIKLECMPVLINADGDKIRQVLINLLDNAIKFSKSGSDIQIFQYLQGDMVVLKILDQGIGVQQDKLDYILDSFYKVDEKSVGTGLGLAITRNIVMKHGGTIEVQSEYGRGTTIMVRLPLNGMEKELD
ncbi:HAMP domain-containing histidine kinase [Metabacillus idriensis]|uniref:sensor histidine kinase n=1 Tax=Metabacillus idriensis TaxID=324768 RepID=UPI00203A9E17|nr:HAMP domain-containing sensor histidine kinase [Metabacillus idriensis]MCM3595636.1 HAMP domain-containing histidine kinase [Metabacillus idriensis]